MNAMHRLGSLALLILVAIARTLAPAQEKPVQPPKKESAQLEVPKNKAILDIDVPPGTKVTIDGEASTTLKRTYRDMAPGKRIETEVVAHFKDGSEAKRRVFLEGGWHVRVPLFSAQQHLQELLLQTGHGIGAVVFSKDGRYLVTGSEDHQTAILWDVATGRQLRVFAPSAPVYSVALSGDGQYLLTGSYRVAHLWEFSSGKLLHKFTGHDSKVRMVAFSPDGKKVMTADNGWAAITEPQGPVGDAKLWDRASGQLLFSLRGQKKSVEAIAFSADGRQILTANGFGLSEIVVWETDTGKKLHACQLSESLLDVSHSPDGWRVLTVGKDHEITSWDIVSGNKLKTAAFKKGWPADGAVPQWFDARDPDKLGHVALDTANSKNWVVAHSRDFLHVASGYLTGAKDKKTGLAEWAFGIRKTNDNKVLQVLNGSWSPLYELNLTSNGLLFCGTNETATVRDLKSGHRLYRLQEAVKPGNLTEFRPLSSPDGRYLLLSPSQHLKKVQIHNANTGQLLHTHQFEHEVWFPAFSPDSRTLLLVAPKGKVLHIDVETGKLQRSFNAPKNIRTVAFSSDGRRIIASEWVGAQEDSRAFVWDAASGVQIAGLSSWAAYDADIHLLSGANDRVARAYFGYDFRKKVHRGEVTVWNPNDSTKVSSFEIEGPRVTAARFSHDGKEIAFGDSAGVVGIRNVSTGKEIRRFWSPAANKIVALGVSKDERMLLAGSANGSIGFWDLATGMEIGRLVDLNEEQDWVMVTPEGLFDGSVEGRQKVTFRIGGGLNVVPVDRFFQDFYRPGLLAAIMRGERPMPDTQLGKTQPPLVRIVSPKDSGSVEKNAITLDVEVSDQGGGIQGPWLYVNGARVLADGQAERAGKVLKRKFEAQLTEGSNRLEVKASCGDGSWESEPAVVTLRYEKPLAKPDLYVVAVGVSDYAEGSYKLKYAKTDAQAMADLFQKRGKALYADVHITTLLDKDATRDAIRKTMQDATKKARPQDTLVLFLAGHGAMVGQRYYFIPHEVKIRAGKNRDEDIREQALPADVLGEFLSLGPAQRRILILDTCASGGAVDLFQVAARDSFAFRGDLERLSRSQGIHVLAAAAAGEEAKEPEQLGHGVLTYTLLAGMRAVRKGPLERRSVQPSSPNQVVDVLEWLSFAEGHVRTLTEQLYGRAQNVHFVSRGSSFPVLPLVDR